MGRGARATVRWKHDRIRRKKRRAKRKAASGAPTETVETTGAVPPRPA
jgi:hypothetical protein